MSHRRSSNLTAITQGRRSKGWRLFCAHAKLIDGREFAGILSTMNKLAALFLLLLLPSCEIAPGTASAYFVAYTGDSVEIHSIQAQGPKDVSGLGYNRKTKVAYLAYADGSTTRLKVVGGGFGNNTFALILEGGSRISVDLKTGKVTTTGDQFGGKEPVMPQ